MRNKPRTFYRENEIVRRVRRPPLEARSPLQGIKSSVDFQRIEFTRGERQLGFLRQILRIKCSAPRLVAPSRNSNADCAGSCHIQMVSDFASDKCKKSVNLGANRDTGSQTRYRNRHFRIQYRLYGPPAAVLAACGCG